MRIYTIQYSYSSGKCQITTSVRASSAKVAERRFWAGIDASPITPAGRPMFSRKSVKVLGVTSRRIETATPEVLRLAA